MAGYYTVRTKRHRLKKGRLLFLLAIFAFLLLLLFSSRFLGTLNNITDKSDWAQSLPSVSEDEPEHVLLYTVSAEGKLKSITLSAVRTDSTSVRLVLIPADTIVNSDRAQTLAQVYTDGKQKSLVSAVEELFNTKVHSFMQINESALGEVMDLLDTSVPAAVPVIATSDDLTVYLEDDTIALNEQFERRRVVLAALGKKVLSGNVFKDIFNFRMAAPLLTTDLSWRQIISLLKSFEKSSFKDVAKLYPLPGFASSTEDSSYFEPDTDSLPYAVVWLDSNSSNIPKAQITVEVLNGCGVAGIATNVAQLLRDEGFNVKSIGNAEHFDYELSQVISRSNNIEVAKEVAVIIPNAQLLKEDNTDSNVLVTVIVGKNYNTSE